MTDADQTDASAQTETVARQSTIDPRVAARLTAKRSFLRRRLLYGKPAVKWLSVRQLLRTAQEVVLATLFARFADKREAMAAVPGPLYRFGPATAGSRVRVDFAADTGDGFDATLAVARLLASGQVPGGACAGPADLLFLGGDEVYPVANADDYRERLTRVFLTARRMQEQDENTDEVTKPLVFALPGNHDWYDGLVGFRRTFCESWALTPELALADSVEISPATASGYDRVGGWYAAQSRSYFAVEVHPSWWVWGVDSQLNAPIDAAQLDYFRAAASQLGPDQGLVVCWATPCWLSADAKEPHPADEDSALFTMTWLLRRVFQAAVRESDPDTNALDPRIRLLLTGDKHHYVRYDPVTADSEPRVDDWSEVAGPVLVTCGGGGAFTSSTHHLSPDLAVPWRRPQSSGPRPGGFTRYQRSEPYPTVQASKRMRREIWLMGTKNGPFLPALIGALLTWVFARTVEPIAQAGDSCQGVWSKVCSLGFWGWLPLAVALLAMVGFAAMGVRGRHGESKAARIVRVAGAALLHLLLHLLVVSVAALIWIRLDAGGPFAWAVLFLGLTVAGTMALTAYLVGSDCLGYHETETFSSIRSKRFKSILRMSFEADTLEVQVVGLDDVPPARRADVDLTGGMPRISPRIVDTFFVDRVVGDNFGTIEEQTDPSDTSDRG